MGAEADSGESSRIEEGGGGGGASGGSNGRATAEEEGVAISIRCANGVKFTVRTALQNTVAAFKAALANHCDIPAAQQKLIYKGRILKDDQATLQSYGLQADHTVHIVRGFGPASSTPAPVAAPNPGSLDSTSGTTGTGTNEGGLLGDLGPGVSLFPGLGVDAIGGSDPFGLFGSGLSELELSQDPGLMRDIINMPATQSLMNNPEIMRSMVMSNPQVQELINRNPELAHVLNDPSIIQQAMDATRNPELMREMMRNSDRAMSNIESSPEGFNMLRRMYENIQEPILNATSIGGNTGNNLSSIPFAGLIGNPGETQVRDVSNTSSTSGSESAAGRSVPNTSPLPNPWSNPSGVTERNSTTRLNPTGDMRLEGLGGLEGLDLSGTENLFPNASQLNQMLQNPAISQMMQRLMSNPAYMNSLLNDTPQLRDLADLNPQFREMMLNPELLHQLSSPETMQQMLSLQESLLPQLGQQQGTWDSPESGTTPAGSRNNSRLELLMNMLGGLGDGSLSAPSQPDVPPEELYATQLAQLVEMGFFDTQENIRALHATAGNVHAAIERLLGNLGQ